MVLKVELRTESDPTTTPTVLGQAFIQVQIPEPGTGALALTMCAPLLTRRRLQARS